MIKYSNKEINNISKLEVGDKKELKKFEWTEWVNLVFNKEIKFTWRW